MKTRDKVLELLKRGLSNKEIRQETGRSNTAIQHHIRQIMKEFGLYGNADYRRLIVCLLTGKNGVMKLASPQPEKKEETQCQPSC